MLDTPKVLSDVLGFKLSLLGANNLEKRILQKEREPTILENSRLSFIESVYEN